MTQYNNAINTININTPVTSVAASYTALLTDYVIEVTDTTSARTITLPAPSLTGATANKGKIYFIKDASGAALTNGNAITVAPATGTIDGAANVMIVQNYGSVQVECDGTNWYTLSLTATGITWTAQAGGVSLKPSQNYWSTAATAQNFPLPTICPAGTTMELAGAGAGLVTITQAAGQSIRFGNLVTTTGTGGSLASSAQGDAIKLLCTVANTTFEAVTGAIGNWIVT